MIRFNDNNNKIRTYQRSCIPFPESNWCWVITFDVSTELIIPGCTGCHCFVLLYCIIRWLPLYINIISYQSKLEDKIENLPDSTCSSHWLYFLLGPSHVEKQWIGLLLLWWHLWSSPRWPLIVAQEGNWWTWSLPRHSTTPSASSAETHLDNFEPCVRWSTVHTEWQRWKLWQRGVNCEPCHPWGRGKWCRFKLQQLAQWHTFTKQCLIRWQTSSKFEHQFHFEMSIVSNCVSCHLKKIQTPL